VDNRSGAYSAAPREPIKTPGTVKLATERRAGEIRRLSGTARACADWLRNGVDALPRLEWDPQCLDRSLSPSVQTCLSEFVRLAHASEEDIAAFAQRWGVLGFVATDARRRTIPLVYRWACSDEDGSSRKTRAATWSSSLAITDLSGGLRTAGPGSHSPSGVCMPRRRS
jgi:hypothetical protein